MRTLFASLIAMFVSVCACLGQPQLELVAPAPGCPVKLPTYGSAKKYCDGRTQRDCSSEKHCSWVGNACSHGLTFIDHNLDMPEATTTDTAKHVDRGDRYVARRQYDNAIAEYTRALIALPNDPTALVQRAKAYEYKGDKTRAVVDYCYVRAAANRASTRTFAGDRIAALTGVAASPRAAAPNPVALSLVPPPPTGVLESAGRRGAIAPLSIEVGSGTNYLLKFVRVDNSRDFILIFAHGGQKYSTKMPLGTYHVRAATGSVWYGRKDLFGPQTRFIRLRAKDGQPQRFSFYRSGNMVHGLTLRLRQLAIGGEAGSMEEETIPREQF